MVFNPLSLAFFIFLCLISNIVKAQFVSQTVVSSAGNSTSFNGGTMEWTLGEVTIDTYASSNLYFTQGFHQPIENNPIVLTDFFIPQGFSPNNDGINDLFVIRGINNYPNNYIEIYNRWGVKVFEASPYQNNWDGKSQNTLSVGNGDLPIGTYFYVLHTNVAQTPFFKGTIYLNK